MCTVKYDYVKGYCEPSHYLCLMPIAYEKEADGYYHKKEMVCSLVKSKECSLSRECPHFINADSIHKMPTLLKDKI